MARNGTRNDYEEAIKDDSPLTDYVHRKREKEREIKIRESRKIKKNTYVDSYGE